MFGYLLKPGNFVHTKNGRGGPKIFHRFPAIKYENTENSRH